MNPSKGLALASCLILAIAPSVLRGQSHSLEDLYRSGRLRLIEEVRITDAQLPKGFLFENPRGLAVDAEGDVYISDYGACQVMVFERDGKFLRVFGRKGQGPGDLGSPESIEVAGRRIRVREVENLRLSILELDGKYVTSVPFAPDSNLGRFLGLRSLPDGRLIVLRRKVFPRVSGEDFRTSRIRPSWSIPRT